MQLEPFLQLILPQSRTGGSQIHHPFRQTNQRGQFDGAVQLDDLRVHTPFKKVTSGNVGKLCGHSERTEVTQRLKRGIHAGGSSKNHAAIADPQVQYLKDVLACFHEDILPHKSHVRRTVLHVCGHIRRPGGDDTRPLRSVKHQLAGVGTHFTQIKTGPLQKRRHLFEHSAATQGYAQTFHAIPTSPAADMRRISSTSWSVKHRDSRARSRSRTIHPSPCAIGSGSTKRRISFWRARVNIFSSSVSSGRAKTPTPPVRRRSATFTQRECAPGMRTGTSPLSTSPPCSKTEAWIRSNPPPNPTAAIGVPNRASKLSYLPPPPRVAPNSAA